MEAGLAKLTHISRAEGVPFGSPDNMDAVLKRILKVTAGDLRRAVGLLQSASQLRRTITVADAEELAGVVPEQVVQDAAKVLTDKLASTAEVTQWVQKRLVTAGYPAHQFVDQVSRGAVHHAAHPL